MNNIEIEKVINLVSNKRYEYFIKKICDYEEVWGLYNNGWASMEDDSKDTLIPFWPMKEYANLCKTNEWINYEAFPISLDDFLNKWIPGMNKDKRNFAIFVVKNDFGIKVTPEQLEKDINLELENY